MASVRRIQQIIQERKRESDDFWRARIPHVLESRLIIRPDSTSYLDKVGVYSSTLLRRHLSEGRSEESLIEDYPGLTQDDIQVCSEFEILRMLKLL